MRKLIDILFIDSSKWMRKILKFTSNLIIQFLIVGIFTDHQSNRSSLHTHCHSKILSTGCVAIRYIFFFADGWQMAHDFNRVYITSKDCNSSFTFSDSCLHILQAINNILCPFLGGLLYQLVDFFCQFTGCERLGNCINILDLFVYNNKKSIGFFGF